MIQSRLTSKAQTTIPAPVRKARGLREGDLVSYRIEQGCLMMTRADDLGDNPSLTSSDGTARKTAQPMPTSAAGFVPGTVVRVPLPDTDAATRRHRPALVVGTAGPGPEPFPLWVLMITSAGNRGWPGDVGIADRAAAGLPAPSFVRTARIATIERARAEATGRISMQELTLVGRALAERLRIEPPDGDPGAEGASPPLSPRARPR